jgi:methyl-accepting chemotaxis protein
MLEARKLSDELQRRGRLSVWSALSLLSALAAILFMCSVWVGVVFGLPQPDASQEKMVQDHAPAVAAAGQLVRLLGNEQELNADLFERLSELSSPLEQFARTSANGLRVDPQSRDPQAWPGRANLIVDELKILISAKESLLGVLNLREAVIGLYKPRGSVNPLRFPELSATRGFYLTSLEWAQATTPDLSAPKMTWGLLAKGKPAWRQLNSQVAALAVEAKLEDDTGRGKIAQDLLSSLDKSELSQHISRADGSWTQTWLALERARASLEKLPPLPIALPEEAPWTWKRLAYPGGTADGIRISVALLLLGLVLQVGGLWARHKNLRSLSDRWLNLTQQLENAVRGVDAPLSTAATKIETLSADFSLVQEQLRQLRQSWQSVPAEHSLQDDAWAHAARMQRDLDSELTLLREKLLNIHLQFCSGTTRENLVYDLAFTTEAIDTISNSARDLGRSIELLKESLSHHVAMDSDEAMDVAIRQVDALKNATKRTAIQLHDLSGRLQVAVEDVPEGRRFEFSPIRDEQGRLRGNTPV